MELELVGGVGILLIGSCICASQVCTSNDSHAANINDTGLVVLCGHDCESYSA